MPRKKSPDSLISRSDQFTKLLDSAVRHVLEYGIGDMSLRRIAESLGTSHRMLIYHFGSSAAFWETVLREIRHREQMARVRNPTAADDPVHAIEEAWTLYSSDAYLPLIRLLFEIYVRAIREPERFEDFMDDVVSSWTKTIAVMFQNAGFDRSASKVRADLQVAVMRGLLLQLLATGDRDATTKAVRKFALMVTRRE